jgi:Uma2 family endonuclease
MATRQNTILTPEQYLEIERKSQLQERVLQGRDVRHGWGATGIHQLVASLVRELSQEFRARLCDIYPGDMRVHVKSSGLYTYPDVTAVCGEQRFVDEQADTLLNPSLIVEVLSPLFEGYDRGKFEQCTRR